MGDYKAFLFDMDGTLIDSMWMWKSIDIEYLGRFGIALPENLQKEIEGMNLHQSAIYFKERFGIQDSLEQMEEEWVSMAWEKYTTQVPLKPGAYEFLKKAHAAGIHMGICSSNSRALVEQVLRVLKVYDFFDVIVTGSDVEHGKPAPDIYLKAATSLGVEPKRCLVFEDIIPGIRAGHNAGMKVCGVDDNYSVTDETEKKEQADFYITDFTEGTEGFL